MFTLRLNTRKSLRGRGYDSEACPSSAQMHSHRLSELHATVPKSTATAGHISTTMVSALVLHSQKEFHWHEFKPTLTVELENTDSKRSEDVEIFEVRLTNIARFLVFVTNAWIRDSQNSLAHPTTDGVTRRYNIKQLHHTSPARISRFLSSSGTCDKSYCS